MDSRLFRKDLQRNVILAGNLLSFFDGYPEGVPPQEALEDLKEEILALETRSQVLLEQADRKVVYESLEKGAVHTLRDVKLAGVSDLGSVEFERREDDIEGPWVEIREFTAKGVPHSSVILHRQAARDSWLSYSQHVPGFLEE
jgi:hypothetical protein